MTDWLLILIVILLAALLWGFPTLILACGFGSTEKEQDHDWLLKHLMVHANAHKNNN